MRAAAAALPGWRFTARTRPLARVLELYCERETSR